MNLKTNIIVTNVSMYTKHRMSDASYAQSFKQIGAVTMAANSIISKSSKNMFFVTPKGLTVVGNVKTYDTYDEMIHDENPPEFAWCIDATGDNTVSQGSAFYAYKASHWTKLYESEAMDTDAINKPNGYDELVETVTNLQSRVDELQDPEALVNHINDLSIHVSSEEKRTWNNKVDKEIGKGLSTNDFTNRDKQKLESLENYNDAALVLLTTQLQSSKADKSQVNEIASDLLLAEEELQSLDNTITETNILLSSLNNEVNQQKMLLSHLDEIMTVHDSAIYQLQNELTGSKTLTDAIDEVVGNDEID